jgi:hypothetical protein
MNNTFKLAAPVIIAGVAAAGAHVKKTIIRNKTKKLINEKLETLETPFVDPWTRAQTMISTRMLSGYYDDKPDAVVMRDFEILFANFQNN